MFGKKLEIKIDKMRAINKSGKRDMYGEENAVGKDAPIKSSGF